MQHETNVLEGVDVSLVCVLLQFRPPRCDQWEGGRGATKGRRADGCEQSQPVVSIVCHWVCLMFPCYCIACHHFVTALSLLVTFQHILSHPALNCHSVTQMPFHTLSKANFPSLVLKLDLSFKFTVMLDTTLAFPLIHSFGLLIICTEPLSCYEQCCWICLFSCF